MSQNTDSLNSAKTGKEQVRKLTLAAMLTAVVVVLALLGTAIKFGTFNINLALVPIVIGAALLGVGYGAWFGLVNAAVILLSGDAAPLAVNVFGTIVTVVAKGVLAGLLSGLVFKLMHRFNKYAAVVCAALACPLVNTGIFLIGCRLFFWDTIAQWAEGAGASSAFTYAIVGLVGGNFLLELAINVILAPAIARILGFSTDRNASLAVYGSVLAAVGLGFAIFAVILMKNAWNDAAQNAISAAVKAAAEVEPSQAMKAGELAGQTSYEANAVLGTRYLVMALFSIVALLGGTTMIGIGKARKS